jgi:hypothetical protein
MKAKLALFISLVLGSGVAFAEDTTVRIENTPSAAQKTIQSQVADGQMGDITKRAQDEETVYDVGLTAKDGSTRDFTVAGDGTVESKQVKLEETPAPVQKTIQSGLNGGTLESVDKNLDDASYDATVKGKDGKETDFNVANDGSLSSKEVALTDAPDAVQKTVSDQLGGKFSGGKVTTVDENYDDDGKNYDVAVATPRGPAMSFNVQADGTLASQQVAFDSVPPRAKAAIQNRIGDGTVLRVDKSFGDNGKISSYDVECRKDGKPFNFSVGPRGKFMGMND